jgi:nicotinate-nucleotide adenylyltransferase
MAKIGLFAGTFDPVHDGHIGFALAALAHCQLDKVVFLPEPAPRGKQQVTPIEKRVDMLRLATLPHSSLRVHALADQQFTVKGTLPQLQQLYGDDLLLLVGSDIARHMPYWPDAPELFKVLSIAVAQRRGDTLPDMPRGTVFVPTSYATVAASHIRSGESQAVAPEVREYIQNNRLYVV